MKPLTDSKYEYSLMAVFSYPNFIVYFLYSEGFWKIVYDLRFDGSKDKKDDWLLSPNTPLEHYGNSFCWKLMGTRPKLAIFAESLTSPFSSGCLQE